MTEDRDDSADTSLLVPSQYILSRPKGCISTRYVLVILGFFGFFNTYLMRVNLSVAIVAMVDSTSGTNETAENNESCPGELHYNSSQQQNSTSQTFLWDEDTQSQILSAFFYGYIITHLPGGLFASRYGGKWIFGCGIFISSILTLFTPLAASAGVGWFITLRVLEGIAEGVIYPAMYAMMGQWAPPYERTRMLMFTLSGSIVGILVANPMAGLLCDSDFLHGWPSVFYISGICGVIWFVFWALLVYDTPAKHPRISAEEREYIEKSIGPRQMTSLRVPFLSMLTSLPFWAIIISQFCIAWGNYTILIELPSYLKNILKFDISQSGLLSSLPPLLHWLTFVPGAAFADYLRQNGILSTIATRKLFNSVGCIIQAISLGAVSIVGCNKILAVAFFCLSSIGFGAVSSGYAVNHLDIAPKYAGVLMGIGNMAGSSTGFLGPTVVGVLTEHNDTIERWRIVFWICCGLIALSFITFLLMASGEEQSWAKTDAGALDAPVVDYNTTQYFNDTRTSINPDGLGPQTPQQERT